MYNNTRILGQLGRSRDFEGEGALWARFGIDMLLMVSGNGASQIIFFTAFRGPAKLRSKKTNRVSGADRAPSSPAYRKATPYRRIVSSSGSKQRFPARWVGARNDRRRRLGLAHVVRQARCVGGNVDNVRRVRDHWFSSFSP
jgi:hypothetical protein